MSTTPPVIPPTNFILQTQPFTVDKNLPSIKFMNQVIGENPPLTHLFNLDGSVIIGNDLGDSLEISPLNIVGIKGISIQIFYDANYGLVKQVFSKSGQTVTIIYDFYKLPDRVKITIEGHLAGSVTLKLPLIGSKIFGIKGSQVFANGIGFNWEDIIQGENGCIGVSWDKPSNQLVLTLEKDFYIDPSTIYDGNWAIPPQCSNLFYYGGLYWYFHRGTGGYLTYHTSADGVTWSAEQSTPYDNNYNDFSMCLQDSTISVVRKSGTSILYNYGTLNSNGTISWAAGTETIYVGGLSASVEEVYDIMTDGTFYWYYTTVYYDIQPSRVNICRDSNGKVFVCFNYYVFAYYYDWRGDYQEYMDDYFTSVYMGNATNGSFGSGREIKNLRDVDDTHVGGLYSIGDGNIVFFYRGTAYTYTNGSHYSNPTAYTLSSSGKDVNTKYFSGCVNGATICFVMYGAESGTRKLWYIEFANNTWSTWTSIPPNQTILGSGECPNLGITIDPATGNKYVFYTTNTSSDTYTVNLTKQIGGIWSDYETFITDTSLIYRTAYSVTKYTNGVIGLVYYINGASCFDQIIFFPQQYGGLKIATPIIPATGLFSSGWDYRKKITITGSTAGAVTNYPICIKVYFGSGTDGIETVNGTTAIKVYTTSLCKTDFGDLRFTTSDGSTLLDYWIEEQNNSNYAIVWVEVDAIPASPSTKEIQLWFGNATATSVSNGTNTWLLFETFENTRLAGWVDGYLLSTNKYEYSSTSPIEGSYSLHFKTGRNISGWDNMIYKGTTYTNLRFKATVKRNYADDDVCIGFRIPTSDCETGNSYDPIGYLLSMPRSGNARFRILRQEVGYTGYELTGSNSSSYAVGTYKLQFLAYNTSLKACLNDEVLNVTDSTYGNAGYVALSVPEWDSNRNPSFDQICIGNYISPEPTLSSVGSLEDGNTEEGGNIEICLVDRGNGNPNITYKPRIKLGNTIYDIYLVDTTDANASKWHINTSQGIKAVRKKT